MKKIIVIAICVLSAARLFAQYDQGQHEISVSGGLISGRYIADYFNGKYGPSPYTATPSYFVSYKYFIFYFMAVGITAGTQTIWEVGPDNYTYASLYALKIINNTFAIEITFAYPTPDGKGRFARRSHGGGSRFVRPYAVLGYGYSFASEAYTYQSIPATYSQTNTRNPNFQVTLIGLRFGGSLAGFIELGVGYKGLINGGVAYNIGWNRRSDQGRAIR